MYWKSAGSVMTYTAAAHLADKIAYLSHLTVKIRGTIAVHLYSSFEACHEETNILHMQNQRRRSASR